MEAATQKFSGQLRLDFLYALYVSRIPSLGDILRQSVERDFLIHEVTFEAQNGSLRTAIRDPSNDRRQGDNSRREAVCA